MCNLVQYNAAHMTDKTRFVKGVVLSRCTHSFAEVMKEFQRQRNLRKPSQDFLGNEGQPIYDGDRRMLLTGCDSTAVILARLFGTVPKIIAYPHWCIESFGGNKNLTFVRFFLLQKKRILLYFRKYFFISIYETKIITSLFSNILIISKILY